MTEFYIEYNPYTVSCIFKKNGVELGDKSKFHSKKNERLQMFLSPNKNAEWLGLPEEIVHACNDKYITLLFKGRQIDYDDLNLCIKEYNKLGEANIKLRAKYTKNDNNIIEELDKIVADIKKRNLPDFKKKNKSGKDIFEAYDEVKNNQFDISVIATMSSGKSTLINALLNTELLPSKNEACTATIARIYDDDTVDGFKAVCYNEAGNEVYPWAPVDRELMNEYNSDEKVKYIDIIGKIAGIDGSKMKLCLRDTPGPNNARNEHHGELTDSMIRDKNSVILYVMNATQFGINDDKNLLQLISNEMKKTGKQSHDRFIFVINKCDEWDEAKDGDLSNLIRNVTEYLEGFDILNPIIIPISALTSLVLRKKINGVKLTRAENKIYNNSDQYLDYEDLHFEKYATLTPTVRKKMENELELGQQYNDDESQILVHTGIRALEETINEYIDKYAYPIKIADSIKDIRDILTELDMVTKFQERISSGEQALKEIREQIARSKAKYEKSKVTSSSYKNKVAAIGLDSDYERNSRKKVERELAVLSKPFDNKGIVDKKEADRLIDEFQSKLMYYVGEVERELNLYMEKQVFDKCEKMLTEYKKTVNSILSGIQINGYDFRKLSSFKKVEISGLEDIKKSNSQDRFREETYYVKNPDRHWFTFWRPREVSRTRTVKDGVDVDILPIILSIITSGKKQIDKNITGLISQTESQIEDYKRLFNGNINLLDVEIMKIFEDLESKISDSKKKQTAVNQDQDTKKWLEKTTDRIDTLLKL